MAGTRIGIIGTGRMGTAFAKRLLECGHAVSVWNRTRSHAGAAEAAGAAVADTLAALVGQSDVILSSLTNFDALEAVYGEIAGLPADALAGKTFVEMSTVLPDEQKATEAMVRKAGGAFLECPVGGTVGPALKGQLLGMAGGDESAWQTAKPILDKLCKSVNLLGPAGTGAAMKLAVNLPLAIYWNTLGESLNLLAGTGLSGETIVSVIAQSSAGPNVLKSRGQVVADTIDGKDQPGTFDIAGLHKDLALAIRWAREKGRAMPVSETVLGCYEKALDEGMNGLDGASIARFVSGRQNG